METLAVMREAEMSNPDLGLIESYVKVVVANGINSDAACHRIANRLGGAVIVAAIRKAADDLEAIDAQETGS